MNAITLKPLKAYAVNEHDERSGAIYFARHAITARKAGANDYGDGELSYVSCTRAPWADRFAGSGAVPASVMVEQGWHFECTCCGVRIDEDLNDRWQEGHYDSLADMLRQARRRRKWTPSMIVGTQHSAVFCDATCEAAWQVAQAETRRIEARIAARFKAIVLRRFPDAEIIDGGDRFQRPHVYVTRNAAGRLVPREVVVAFRFPGMAIAPATLRWDHRSTYRGGKPHWSCCAGDQIAFEAWARGQGAAGAQPPAAGEAA